LEMKTTAQKTIPKAGRAKVPLELEKGELPMNTFGNKAPFAGKIMSVERIVGPKATGETTHIIIDHEGKMPYWEGQSFGVIPPGMKVNSKGKEVPHGVRLYSIASSRYGDNFDGKTATLCVRRATYWDADLGREDPEKKGICSNFLCDAKPGTVVQMTGPTGKVMLLPEDPATVHIMVATGTGIAPFRSYIRRFFCEDIPGYQFKGLAWLFMGVANSDAKLYDDEFSALLARYPDQFRVDYALSREQNNAKGGKMYIQDKVEEYKDQVFDLMNNGAHMYFCGLKGMMPGIFDMLEKVCKEKGINYEEWVRPQGWLKGPPSVPSCELTPTSPSVPPPCSSRSSSTRAACTWRCTKPAAALLAPHTQAPPADDAPRTLLQHSSRRCDARREYRVREMIDHPLRRSHQSSASRRVYCSPSHITCCWSPSCELVTPCAWRCAQRQRRLGGHLGLRVWSPQPPARPGSTSRSRRHAGLRASSRDIRRAASWLAPGAAGGVPPQSRRRPPSCRLASLSSSRMCWLPWRPWVAHWPA
jgi:ferredoxin--NADP+ reductase